MHPAIDLHIWRLSDPAADVALSAHLEAQEIARAARFVRPQHARAHRIARGGLRLRLAEWMGQAPATLRFDIGPSGKPALPGGPFFNLSHSGDLACLAIHRDLELGLDIEQHRPVERGVAERAFSATERAALDALPAAQWMAGFFNGWTRKEAVVKATGAGLSMRLEAFDVTLAPGTPARLTRMDTTDGPAQAWQLAAFALAPDIPAALALRAPVLPPLRLKEAPPGLLPELPDHSATGGRGSD
ncbi:4'-phosphopantetheinyl transferase family protein [Pseudooceanicola aestuarii]|uniref:4'-phosphopantetheinyl transferase family protein n=1 Tax=Pseudooceanicola aestuarii TaxID=2697319 RepID=UPI0013CFFC6E|nr:4'-phosphopantetheinyl transferase superfamily protein [Pseudooceanicola aestuarii]